MPTINPSLKNIQSEIATLDVQAKHDQGVKGKDFDKVLAELGTLEGVDGIDKDKVAALKNDVTAMKSLTLEPEKNTESTNNRWKQGFAEINKMINDLGGGDVISQESGGHGAGTGYKGLTGGQTDIAGLPETVAALQRDDAPGGPQQVNKFQDGEGKSYYVTSGNGDASKNYKVFNEAGEPMGEMTAPGALGLNDGKTWLALSDKGIGNSWTTTDPKSLPADAQMFDLNGAAGNGNKIVSRGANEGGAAAAATDSDTVNGAADGHGPGTAYKGLSAEQAATAGLKGDLVGLQSKDAPGGAQQINKIQDGEGNNYYVTSGNGDNSKNYKVFDKDGKPMGEMTAPGALGLNDGKTWLALSDKGIGSSWTTDNPTSLPSDAQMFDLSGAAGNDNKIVSRGANVGGGTPSAGPAKLADSAHNKDDPRITDNINTKFWAGATSPNGKSVFADVMSRDADGGGKSHWLKLKDEDGNEIKQPGLNRGQWGSFTFKNGAQYISSDKGYFMVAGGVAKNIITGETKNDPAEVAGIIASAPADNKFNQEG